MASDPNMTTIAFAIAKVTAKTIATAKDNKHNIDIALRDVSLGFDKVWHNGLKYKILYFLILIL